MSVAPEQIEKTADVVITPNSERIEITPKNGDHYSLEEMQKYVGGYIEVLQISPNKVMIINEEGKLKGLEGNFLATVMYGFDQIVGNAMVIDRSRIK